MFQLTLTILQFKVYPLWKYDSNRIVSPMSGGLPETTNSSVVYLPNQKWIKVLCNVSQFMLVVQYIGIKCYWHRKHVGNTTTGERGRWKKKKMVWLWLDFSRMPMSICKSAVKEGLLVSSHAEFANFVNDMRKLSFAKIMKKRPLYY